MREKLFPWAFLPFSLDSPKGRVRLSRSLVINDSIHFPEAAAGPHAWRLPGNVHPTPHGRGEGIDGDPLTKNRGNRLKPLGMNPD